jgi:hypothetical protein
MSTIAKVQTNPNLIVEVFKFLDENTKTKILRENNIGSIEDLDPNKTKTTKVLLYA